MRDRKAMDEIARLQARVAELEFVFRESCTKIATLKEVLGHCAASIDHLMAFKGSRLEERQRDSHLLNLHRARVALGQIPAPGDAPGEDDDD